MITMSFKTATMAATVAIAAWVVLGFLVNEDYGWGGFVYSPDYVVSVEEGGAAARAGLRNDDRMISVAGIPVEDLPLYSRWPRDLAPLAGEVLPLVVERDGRRVGVEIEYAARGTNRVALGAGLIVASFLVSGIWAMFAAGTGPARLLAGIGLSAATAGAAAAGPYLGTWAGVASHIQFLAVMLWTVLLFRFFILFPDPKPIARNRLVAAASYGTWLSFFPLMVAELVFHPALYHAFGGPGSLIMLGYCFSAIAAAAHTLVKTPRRERRETGMSLILVGLGVAVVPALVGLIDWAFWGSIDIPGSAYFPLSLALIPVFMAAAVVKEARSRSENPVLQY